MSRFSMLIIAGCVVAGSWSPACSQAEDKITYIDLEPQANRKLTDNQGRGLDGNDLNNVPTGEQKFGDLMFKIGPKLIQLGSQMLDSLPATVEGITVKKKFTKLYILHATCFGGGPNEPGGIGYVKDGTPIGEYVVHYKDKTTRRIPIVYGEEVRDWFFAEGEAEPSKSKVVWTGDNEFATDVGCRSTAPLRHDVDESQAEGKGDIHRLRRAQDKTLRSGFPGHDGGQGKTHRHKDK